MEERPFEATQSTITTVKVGDDEPVTEGISENLRGYIDTDDQPVITLSEGYPISSIRAQDEVPQLQEPDILLDEV